MLFSVLILFFVFNYSFAQAGSDTLEKIFSSRSFSLLEDYAGDWGGYTHTFIFTRSDTGTIILWQDPDFPDGETPRELKILFPNDSLKKLQKLFAGCALKIQGSKNKSTERSRYIFKNKEMSYTIDDNFTMLCVDSFKTWKEMLFKEGLKQEKRKKKK